MAIPIMMVSAWAPPEVGVPGTEFHANAGEINTPISCELVWPEPNIDTADWQTVPVQLSRTEGGNRPGTSSGWSISPWSLA